MKAYPPKTCVICGEAWQPANRYQSARNLTCSPECNGKRISKSRTGQPSSRDQRIEVACSVCGKPTKRPPSHAARVATPVCSYQCNGKLRAKTLVLHSGNMKGRKRKDPRFGPDNPAWKGGVTYFRKHGNYKPIKYVRCPPEFLPMARKDGYVMEHRLLMARRVGYLLLRTEVVHHLDHNPQNNTDDNTELWPDNRSHKTAEGGRIVPGAACRCFPKVSALP